MDYDEDTFLPLDISPLMFEPDPNTECWIWGDQLWNFKYARYTDPDGHREYLHRVIMINKYGEEFMRDKVVVWSCGNDHCINHEHMKPRPRVMARMGAKFTLEELAIAKGYLLSGLKIRKVVEKFNGRISRSYCEKLRSGECYPNLEPIYKDTEDLLRNLKGKKDDGT